MTFTPEILKLCRQAAQQTSLKMSEEIGKVLKSDELKDDSDSVNYVPIAVIAFLISNSSFALSATYNHQGGKSTPEQIYNAIMATSAQIFKDIKRSVPEGTMQ
jgi:hypothetical protein